MKKLLLALLFISASCSVTDVEKSESAAMTDQTKKSTKNTTRTVRMYDNVKYTGHVNKNYLFVAPVREHQGQYYFVDNNNYVMLNCNLKYWYAGQGHPAPLPEYIQKYPLKGSKTYYFDKNISHVIVFVMDPWWTNPAKGYIGAAAPNYEDNSYKSLVQYIIPVNGDETMIGIHGFWKFIFTLSYRVYSTIDY